MADGALTLRLDNINCAGCAARAEKAIADEVSEATVNPATSTLRLPATTLNDLRALDVHLGNAGYPMSRETYVFQLQGMTCASCVAKVERAVLALPEVTSASANFATGALLVEARALQGWKDQVSDALAAAGYPVEADETSEEPEKTAWHAAALAAILTLPVFVLEMGGHLFAPFHHWVMATIGVQTSWTLQAVLTAAVIFGPGRHIFARGFQSLRRRSPDMDALVALGAGAAFLYSLVVLLLPDLVPAQSRAVYFEAAAVIVTLILLGRTLEERAKGRAGAAIRALMNLQPETAQRRTPDGHFETVPARRLVTGDVILLRAGDRVPADARVIEGEGVVEEAMLTGEPMPATKRAGDPVYAGTINGRSALTLSVENAGDSTALARIIATVEEAQAAKLPIQALINKVTAVFVPIVLLIAVLTFLVWWAFSGDFAFALVAAVSVLIIACPCAMGLATPVSIMVGTGRAAELGVLFRKGDALQSLAKVTLVAFDKTGTLTQGAPSVTEVHTAQGVSKAEALALFASLEQGSAHPIAKALLQESEKHGIPQLEASDIKTSVGRGVMGNISGSKVFVGSTRFLEEQGIAVPRTDAQTATPVHLARDGQYLATALIADPLKPDARAAIDALHARGIKTALVSGDTEATAQAVAAQTGITEVYASVLPSEKAAIVEQLRTKHGQVAFVGDGINDAPALASATVGIALGTGTDVAIEAADVVLMSDDIGAVVIALEASTATLANIRQNLGWAFGYNALLIPVAAGVFYPLAGVLLSPMVAAGAMALSSVFVVSNALRLKRLRPTL